MLIPNFTWIEAIYFASSIIGGLFFLLRLLLFFFGIGGDVDELPGGEIDGDVDLSDGDGDPGFKLLSLQSLSAFFMMFGLSGLTLISTGIQTVWVILGSVLVGFFAVWVISLLFTAVRNLQSEGTLKIENAIGETGSVYLRIPAHGKGQVSVTIQGRLKIYDAVSANKVEIGTGEVIRVVDVTGSRILIVEKE